MALLAAAIMLLSDAYSAVPSAYLLIEEFETMEGMSLVLIEKSIMGQVTSLGGHPVVPVPGLTCAVAFNYNSLPSIGGEVFEPA